MTILAQPLLAQPAGKSIIPGEMPPIMQGAVQIGNVVNATVTSSVMSWIAAEAMRMANSQQSEAQIESSARESMIARFANQPMNAVTQQVMYLAARLRAIEKQRERDAELQAAQAVIDDINEALSSLEAALALMEKKFRESQEQAQAEQCRIRECDIVRAEHAKLLQRMAGTNYGFRMTGSVAVTPADINTKSAREAFAAEFKKIAAQAKSLRDAASAKSTVSRNALSAAYAVVSNATKAVDASGAREPALASIAKLF